ncbi:UDP-N-acetylmuramate dehydrogenase, partial [Escherichia coli]|nr:UDP-N-acetylmuramate dehydrogenase [Escherichia coli]
MNNLQTQFPHIAIKLNEPLSKYTYTKTGGAADVFVMPKTIEETQEV